MTRRQRRGGSATGHGGTTGRRGEGERRGDGRRCLAPGCERRVQPGWALCREHRRSEEGREARAAVARLLDDLGRPERSALERGAESKRAARGGDGAEGREEAAARRTAEFWQRVGRGDYGGLLDEPVRAVLAQAAKEQGLELEIGALRMILVRVLTEETDPVRQALGATRVARTLGALVREHGELTGNASDKFTQFLRLYLMDDPAAPDEVQGVSGGAYAEEHFKAELEAFDAEQQARRAALEVGGGDNFDETRAAIAAATSWEAVERQAGEGVDGPGDERGR